MFFSFDGIDGAGKSTQVEIFCNWLRSEGFEVVACRDPGSTPLGEQVRALLLQSGEVLPIHRRSEMFLYMAARAQLVEEIIRPALEAGEVVVADRFVLANIVYQGYGGELDVAEVRRVGEICTAGIRPDCVFVLDIAPEDARLRFHRELDRMEREGADFHRRIREGFLKEAAAAAGSLHLVNAARPVGVIQQEVQAIARNVLDARTRRC